MVGIAVLTIVASMANKKITSMTPKAARLRFERLEDDVSERGFKELAPLRAREMNVTHELN
jgi:hypothetical protein